MNKEPQQVLSDLGDWLQLISGMLGNAYNDLFLAPSFGSEINIYSLAMLNQINRFDLFSANLIENMNKEPVIECIDVLNDLRKNLKDFYDHISKDIAKIEELIADSDAYPERNFQIIIIRITKLQSDTEQYLTSLDVTQNQLQKQIFNNIINSAKKEVKNLESATRAINGEKTKEVYITAFNRYSQSARNYEIAFYITCAVSVISTIVVGVLIHQYHDWLYEVIGIKVILALVLITLITLFLRRISHYRKLADEADQKSLELSALPSFMREVKEEDQKEIYKELAGKYFGGGVDHSQNNKIGDLIDDQIKNIVELSRATTETAKGLKEIADPSSNKSEKEETKSKDSD